jgi:hypothetical protein
MQKRWILAGLCALLLAFVGPSDAQEKIPGRFVNSQGFQITGFTVRAGGSGCAGSQNYVKVGEPENKGVSQLRWATVTKQDDGILCSDGSWVYGSGDRKGQTGGSTSNVLIKNGSFYKQ